MDKALDRDGNNQYLLYSFIHSFIHLLCLINQSESVDRMDRDCKYIETRRREKRGTGKGQRCSVYVYMVLHVLVL